MKIYLAITMSEKWSPGSLYRKADIRLKKSGFYKAFNFLFSWEIKT